MSKAKRKPAAQPVVLSGEVVSPSQTALVQVGPMAVLQRAVTEGAAVDVLERLLALQERWEATQARKAFDAAMAALRADLPTIVKSREVDFTSPKGRTHYRYEDLALVTEALSPAMAQHGLSFRWQTDSSLPGAISVTCIVSHAEGHSERTTLSCQRDDTGNKNDIQAIGSAVTYLQRYTLKAAVGVAASADGDGRSRSSTRAQDGRRGAPAAHGGPSKASSSPKDDEPITQPQRQRLWVIVKKSGRTEAEVKAWLAVVLGIDSTKDIKRRDYDACCTAVEAPGPLPMLGGD